MVWYHRNLRLPTFLGLLGGVVGSFCVKSALLTPLLIATNAVCAVLLLVVSLVARCGAPWCAPSRSTSGRRRRITNHPPVCKLHKDEVITLYLQLPILDQPPNPVLHIRQSQWFVSWTDPVAVGE
jgi:hypothetical protein